MGSKIVFSAQANRDLEQIVSFLAQKNPSAAERLGHALIDHALSLHRWPNRGAEVAKRVGIRRIVHPPWFLIFYRFDANRNVVEILRFWDGRQNPKAFRLS